MDDRLRLIQDKPRRSFKNFLVEAVPARYVLTLLACLGFINVYALRVNLNVAMVAMVGTGPKNASLTHDCPISDNDTQTEKEGEFDWDEYKQGIALGSFYYGYVVTQIPGGRLAEIVGPKWLYGGGVLWTSVLTLVTPSAARSGFGWLILVRVLEGIGEGVTFPAMHAMLARWMPKNERSFLAAIVYSGSQIGTVISTSITGLLCDTDFLEGWPSAFYLFGTLATIWFVFWALLIHQRPADHPRISKTELRYILDDQGQEQSSTKAPIPWRSIVTSVPLWALVVTHVGQNWGFNTLLSELPTFMARMMHYNLQQNGLLSALPYLLQALTSWIVAYFADRIRKTGRVRISVIRKVCNTISFVGPAACLLGVTWSGCDHKATVTLLTFSVALNGFSYAGFQVTHVDMAPDFAGTLLGITNCIANFPGFLAPMVAGALTDHRQTLARWNIVFYISCIIYVVAALVFIFLGSAELQPWGLASRTDKTTEEEPNPSMECLESIPPQQQQQQDPHPNK